MKRGNKQILFGAVFVTVFGLLVFGLYKSLQPTPTCFDKVQNQEEEGIDCGAVCGNICLQALPPVKVLSSQIFLIRTIDNFADYDALFKVNNPNVTFGSGNVEYDLRLFDANDNTILSKTGSFYILPGQTKYIYEPLLKTELPAVSAELTIKKVDWQKLEGVFNEDIKLATKAKDYLLDGKPGVFSRVVGTISNLSDFDLNMVDVVVVLFKNNIPVGANRTDMRTLTAGEDRFFEVDWINQISETPDRVDVEASANIFNDSNFIKLYGIPEKFQGFY